MLRPGKSWPSLFVALLSTATFAAPPKVEPIRIGAVLSLSGPAASYGGQQRAGIEAAVEEINRAKTLRAPLEVLIEDDASTKEGASAAFHKFIERDKVSAILGPTLSTSATVADVIAQGASVPVLGVSNTASTGITDIGNFIWRDSLTEAHVIPGSFRAAYQKLNFSSAGVLFGDDDVFTRSGHDVMDQTLRLLKVRIVGTQTFTKPDKDFTAKLQPLLAAHPDVLVVSALADNAVAIVIQARKLGWKGPILGGNGFNSPGFLKNAGAAADGVITGTAWNAVSAGPENQRFIRVMAARGATPDQFSAQAYTGVLIFAEAIRHAGGKSRRADIEAGLSKVKAIETPLGSFSFTPDRDASHWPSAQIVVDGKFQLLH